ncbi:MAG TPA: hypothetical protein VGJ13_05100 [Pseudonocardiaceae bacterium]|jgi:hypothetical protein
MTPAAAGQVFLPIYEQAREAVAALHAGPKCAVCHQPGPEPCRCAAVIAPAEVHTTTTREQTTEK